MAGGTKAAAAAKSRKRAAPEAADAAAADSSGELLAYVTSLGGGLNGVAQRQLGGMGAGLCATRDLRAGEWVWRVPAAAMVTAQAALASPVGVAIAQACQVCERGDDEDGGGKADGGEWRAAWLSRELGWKREEAAEAATAARAAGGSRSRGRGAGRPAAQEEEEEEDDDDDDEASSSESSGADASPEPPRPRVQSRSVLYAYLIAARAPGSDAAHAVYVRSLPATYNCPLLWTEAECSALEGTELARSVAVMRAHLREEYDALFPRMSSLAPRLFQRKHFSWDAFLWAHAAYSSRCFPRSFMPAAGGGASAGSGGSASDALATPDDDAEADGVLIPVLDVANHSPDGADMCVARPRAASQRRALF
jgi:hypothetical protein